VIEALLAGLFGLLIGSFLNVCIYRLPRDLSVVAPRSFCVWCRNEIAWFDNIPLFSWLRLGGRCRHCELAVSRRYPLVEVITGLLFFYGVYRLGPGLAALKLCIFAAIQVALIFTDLEERILPDEFTLGGVAIGCLFAVLVPASSFLQIFLSPEIDPRLVSLAESILAAGLLSFVLWFVGYIYERIRHRDGLGLGDVKMVAMIGAFAGFQGTLLTLIVGSILGSVIGLAFILIGGKDAATYPLPFGSFLAVGALIVSLVLWA